MRRLLLATLVAVAVAAGAGALALRPDPGALERTQAAFMDDAGFVNGPAAGLTFARASEWLLDDGTACQRRHGRDDARCDVRLAAAAYSGVAAFVVAECTAPGVFEARAAMLDHLRRLRAFDRRTEPTPPPSLPGVPRCS